MLQTALIILVIAIFAGIFGAVLGLGGGMIVTPALTMLFGIDIKYAIGASLIAVIATSSGAAAAYTRDKITNIRAGMFLEIATTIGAVTGAFIAGIIAPDILYGIFGILLLYTAVMMLKKRKNELPQDVKMSKLGEKLNLGGKYYDKALKKEVEYNIDNVYGGFGVMFGAGILSGMLGVGSGSFKVMAMDLFMKIPLKVSSATSNFMMGVTAAASAGVYLFRGNIDPKIAGPVAVGVLIGSTVGARIMQKMKSTTIRKIFVPVILYVSIDMIMKGIGVK